MASRSRRRHGRRGGTGEPNGLQPGDDLGNRRKVREMKAPPDDIGNLRPPEEEVRELPDEVGNRLEQQPTHTMSGVLEDLDTKRRRRRRTAPAERMGRFFVGGVNPLVSGNLALMQREQEVLRQARMAVRKNDAGSDDGDAEGRNWRGRRRPDAIDRFSRRLFDFEGDSRFEYVLQSDPEVKRAHAEEVVSEIIKRAGLSAHVQGRLFGKDIRPFVLVTIDEITDGLEGENDRAGSEGSLFVRGSSALMALNFLINKIVNRMPNDRIRLAILPKCDEALFEEGLATFMASEAAENTAPVEDLGENEGKTEGELAPKAEPELETDSPEKTVKLDAEEGEKESLSTAKKKTTRASAKKTTTKKTATAKKATKKKATAKKSATKKSVTKKSVTKKSVTKKTVAKKRGAK